MNATQYFFMMAAILAARAGGKFRGIVFILCIVAGCISGIIQAGQNALEHQRQIQVTTDTQGQ